MTTEQIITNTPQREQLVRVHFKAQRLLAEYQKARDNGLPVSSKSMLLAHNAVQATSKALRMGATAGLEGVAFEAPIVEPESDGSEDVLNLVRK